MSEILIKIFIETWNVLCEMAPSLLFGFFVAGLLSLLISTDQVKKHLGKDGIKAIFKASLLGVPMPLCSCSVIPVAVSLKKAGASNGATASFLISTPETGIDSIFVTYAILGLPFALFKVVAAFISGVVGGLFINIFAPNKIIEEEDLKEIEKIDECCACSCNFGDSDCDLHITRSSKLKQGLYFGFITLTKDIAKPLLIGLIIAGIVTALVPKDFFAGSIGTGFLSMFIVLLISIPLYVCATASVPIAAALILSGFSPGAALVFLMAGPATNAATISTVWKILGKASAVIYVTVTASIALLSGILFNSVLNISNIRPFEKAHSPLMENIEIISAIVFLLLIAYGILEPYILKKAHNHSH